MVFDTGSVILCVVGLFFLYLFCWFFLRPLKWLLKLLISCLIGGAAIVLLNLVFGGLGWHVPLNPLTAVISGVMSAPGLVMIYVLCGIL